MDLPDYFLADLADPAALSGQLISEACRTLQENREKFLLSRDTGSLIDTLAALAREWLDPRFPFLQRVLEEGPARTGFPRETLRAGLRKFFTQVTRENLERLVVQDLGALRRLDELAADPAECQENRASTARGYPLTVHVAGGSIPNPVLTSLMLGLLARSAQFVKCASGASFIPRMFAHSLYVLQPKLAACIEIAEWKGGCESLEAPLFGAAGCVTATGSDETLSRIARRIPARVKFLGYGHQVSFAFVAREALSASALPEAVRAAVEDIVAWNQLGCLSPHVIYVETGGASAPEDFAARLARELADREQTEPRGPVPPSAAAAITTRRMFYEVRASADGQTRLWASPDSSAWTVVCESDPAFQVSCLNRFIFVKAVPDLDTLLAAAAPVQARVSTVGLSAPPARAQELAARLARWGARRICPLGKMQDPPLTWRHDGRPSLGDLVTWTDFERPV